MSEEVKNAILILHAEITEDDLLQEKLQSLHHVLSKSTLSLLEEYREGMNEFQVKELYWELNTVQSLLLHIIIQNKEGNEEKSKSISFLMDELMGDYEV